MASTTRARRALIATMAAVAAVALPLSAAAGAQAASPDAGLYGSSDPTYDGVYRQSLAMLGLAEAGAKVPAAAVDWLAGQQCLDGSYLAYRKSIRTACPQPDTANFTGPDSNSTALAAMALAATGRKAAADKAAKALVASQNADGGWGYTLGGASDANSTGLVLAALDKSSNDEAAAERRGIAYLTSLAGPCTAGASSLPFQAGQAANDLASAQALLGLNTGLPMAPSHAKYTKEHSCTEALDQRVAEYLLDDLKKGKGLLHSPMDPSKTDFNTTAWAVLALVGANRPAAELAQPVRQLMKNARTFVGKGAAASPAAAGTLALLAMATDGDVRDFGGLNLVDAINATLRK